MTSTGWTPRLRVWWTWWWCRTWTRWRWLVVIIIKEAIAGVKPTISSIITSEMFCFQALWTYNKWSLPTLSFFDNCQSVELNKGDLPQRAGLCFLASIFLFLVWLGSSFNMLIQLCASFSLKVSSLNSSCFLLSSFLLAFFERFSIMNYDMGPLTLVSWPLDSFEDLSHTLDQDPSWRGHPGPPPKNWRRKKSMS